MYPEPPLCIPTSDGGFNLLINSVTDGNYNEYWQLLNGKTGELIKEFKWKIDSSYIPAINTDKMIMIRTTLETNKTIAYNISDSPWIQLYEINSSEQYVDIMIIDEYIVLSSLKVVDVYLITNGTKIFSYPFELYETQIEWTKLSAGLDETGEPLIIVAMGIDLNQPQQTILYALKMNQQDILTSVHKL